MAQGQMTGVLREIYTDIAGSALSDLTNHASFPSRPTLEEILPDFAAPVGWGDNYGQRLRAWFVPPLTGSYIFWIASDDQGALYLSTDETPNRRRLVASVNSWTDSREWGKEVNQKSTSIPLEAGRRYYLEALQKEGGGGDHVAVRCQGPDGRNLEPIPGAYLVPYGLLPPVILGQPADTNVVEGGMANFQVVLDRHLGARFLWTRNGNPIPGATNHLLAIGPVRISDHAASFQVVVANDLGAVTSRIARLSIRPDTTPPALVHVMNLGDPHRVMVVFSEPVDPAIASNAARYQLDRGATVFEARVGPDPTTVVLRTSPLSVDGAYQIRVTGIRDLASTPNTIPEDTRATFNLAITPLEPAKLEPPEEPLGPSTRRGPIVVSEIHYHPMDRDDGRQAEFLEIHNTQPWPESMGGWRLDGDVRLRFPEDLVLPARSYLVVAANSKDVEAIYGITGVLDYDGNLSNGGGRVRLLNEREAVVWEVDLSDEDAWPAAADGAGPSLVLVRPSLGQRDPAAWRASAAPGGTPGLGETTLENSWAGLCLNECLTHTDDLVRDFIELFNRGPLPISLDGCALTDTTSTNRYLLPAGTTIPGRGFLVFDQDQLGFSLRSGGESVVLRHVATGRVIDALRLAPQANGRSAGRIPDGAPRWGSLQQPTPGQPNATRWTPGVVINEVMYEPPGNETAAEFVELRNLTDQSVPLEGWRLKGGVGFQFPSGAVLSPRGLVVVAKDPDRLRALHPELLADSVFGGFSGSLGNQQEHLVLTQPDDILSTNAAGTIVRERIDIPIDEIAYESGGRWPRWAAGGGSSLERLDPREDGRNAGAWVASDETDRSAWVTVEHTGVLDLGNGAAHSLELLLLGAGECLVDNVEARRVNETNRIVNASFDSGLAPWVLQGNQSHSEWVPAGGVNGSPCLRLIATGRGDTANRVRVPLGRALSATQRVTLRAQVRWLRGASDILFRLHGNWLEATTNILTTRALGTPGLPNDSAVALTPPVITEVRHEPVAPSARQPVTVQARVEDADGLSTLVLRYRLDPTTNWVLAPMSPRGGGIFTGVIPGQTNGSLAAFYIEAADNGVSPAVAHFPSDAPEREALVRWGDPTTPAAFGTYRVWLTQRTIDAWKRRERLSNDLLDVTFVYGRDRVIYNVGARYSGSPYHAPGYDSPVGNFCDYQLTFPEDDLLLGETDVNLVHAGNGCCEGTLLRESMAYAIARQLGLPFNHTRHVQVYVNGLRRAPLMMLDSQQANGDFLEQWWPGSDGDGDLHKIALWFEFNNEVSTFDAVGASFGNFVSDGRKKLARYRWNWPRRSAPHSINDYTHLFALHDAMLTASTSSAYTQRLESTVDPDNWARTVAVEHLIGNPDSFAYGGGQNMFTYKPPQGRWQWILWDIDFAFQAEPPTNSVFTFGGAELERFLRHPPFFRMYYRALKAAVDGPMSAAFSNSYLETRYQALRSAGFNPESPQSIKSYLAARSASVTRTLSALRTEFRVSSPPDVVAMTNPVVIQGFAPVEVTDILVNGQAWPVQWTSLYAWTARVALAPGVHDLVVQGRGMANDLIGGTTHHVRVEFKGSADPALGSVFINEWMSANTAVIADPADGGFDDWFEVYNAGTQEVDLGGYYFSNDLTQRTQWRLPPRVILPARGFLQIWADGGIQPSTGTELHAGFQLDRDGEALALFSPSGLLIDGIEFGAQATNRSSGRYPDGGPAMGDHVQPTPGAPNAPLVPPAGVRLTAAWDAVARVVHLTWPARGGARYRLETTTNPTLESWEVFVEPEAAEADGSMTVTVDARSGDARFFRVAGE
ncbi:MAG: lamin tail domain-containing protein [Verrucomicrobiales bacterium]|nr:lamin tail domain-containing protein [Verrucomicrobiales bacterium]